jgi:tRNA pseudouridine38-40 synthase
VCWCGSGCRYCLRKLQLILRYFFDLAYKGTNYNGWQVQPNANTIEAEVINALQTLYQTPIPIVGSGRTDTGVHAKEQVFHAEIDQEIDRETTIRKLNGILPKDIVINDIRTVRNNAHARFDAELRSYEYHIRFKRTPFGKDEYCFLPNSPNAELINKGCKIILGEHDFQSFSKVKTEVNHFKCTIFSAEWQQSSSEAVLFISANRFLRGMVRALTGTLLSLGYGKISLDEFRAILAAKDRTQAGQSVPAQGLYLCEVRYPKEIFLNQ